MPEYTPTTEEIRYRLILGADPFDLNADEREDLEEFDRWLNSVKAEAWDELYYELRGIPHWYDPERQYGEFDMQALGPDETTEQGAFMAVMQIAKNNPYRTGGAE